MDIYCFTFDIDIKVFCMNTDGTIYLDQTNPQYTRMFSKYLIFDVFANGVFLYGTPVTDATTIYTSYNDFIMTNIYFWGSDIAKLYRGFLYNKKFSGHYYLIKKSLRLASYINQTSDLTYNGDSLHCYQEACRTTPELKQDLTNIYHKLIHWQPAPNQQISLQLQNSLIIIVDYLITKSNIILKILPKNLITALSKLTNKPLIINKYTTLKFLAGQRISIMISTQSPTKKTFIVKQFIDDSAQSKRFYSRNIALEQYLHNKKSRTTIAKIVAYHDKKRMIVYKDLTASGYDNNLLYILNGHDPSQAFKVMCVVTRSLANLHSDGKPTSALEIKSAKYFKALRSQKDDLRSDVISKYLNILKSKHCISNEVGLIKEVNLINQLLFAQSNFTTLTHGDLCPDNILIHKNRTRIKFIDFDHASLRSALIDACVFRMNFPSCWCAGKLPKPCINYLEKIYMENITNSFANTFSHDKFKQEMHAACGYWLIHNTTKIPDHFSSPAFVHKQARIRSILISYISMSGIDHTFPHLFASAKQMIALLPQGNTLQYFTSFKNSPQNEFINFSAV